MKFFAAFVVAIAGVFCSAQSISQTIQPNTVWTNQRGSTLTIASIAADGRFDGSYVNRASGFQCQQDPYPVIGWIDGAQISFIVRWKIAARDCRSLTSWTGFVTGNQMNTKWALVYLDSSTQTSKFMNGDDLFNKQ